MVHCQRLQKFFDGADLFIRRHFHLPVTRFMFNFTQTISYNPVDLTFLSLIMVSFVQLHLICVLEIPGCPPDWISDSQSIYCYRLFDSVSGYTFTDAQKACFYERANLLTIENSDEYDFIYGEYSGSHTSPWIGYSDANKEGIFDPIDPNVKPWPEK